MRNNGLKWESRSNLDVVLDIINTDLQGSWLWLKEVIAALPKQYGTVLVFTVLTGLRPTEAANSTHLISELHGKGKLSDYLNQELLMLEHFRYPDLFLRKCKNAYISFITPELLDLITTYEPITKYGALSTRIKRLGKPVKTKELRKYFSTTLKEYLPTEALDLLQGRIKQSVFMRYYYKPFLQSLKAKTLKGIRPLQRELLKVLA